MKSGCFDCGHEGPLHDHHVVPRILGGTMTVALCERCHGLVHGRHMVGHAHLTRAGLNKAREKGITLGRRKGTSETCEVLLQKHMDVARMVADGLSIRKIAAVTGCSTTTVQKVKRVLRNLEV